MKRKITGGTVVTASDVFDADVVIEDGRVTALLAPGTGPKDVDTTDAKGCYVMPGGIDVHTHLDMPFGGTYSSDDFETGTMAAAFGGTTSIVDFATQSRGTTLRQTLDTWHAKAEGKATIDYGFHMIATDLPPAELKAMGDLVREGVTSFKLFMAYKGALLLDDESIFRAMLRAGEIDATIAMHAEAGLPIDLLVERMLAEGKTAPIYHALSRPEAAEATATERTLALAEMANVPVYIVHLTAQRALEHVVAARSRGLPVYAETCPQYLFLSEDDLRGKPDDPFDGAKYVCSPPLRPKYHQEHLWRGLKNHHLSVVSTDHCPFNMKGQKEMGRASFNKIPNGLPSIETRLLLLYEGVKEGRISLNRFVEITATAPAKLFGMYPRKGTIAVGTDADIVVWDPNKRLDLSHKNMHMRVDYSMFEGKVVTGAPKTVLSRGEVIVDNEKFLGRPGRGRYVRRGKLQPA